MAQGACTGGGHQHCSASRKAKQFVGEAGIERLVGFSHPALIHSGYLHLQQLLNLNFGGFFVFEVGGVIQGNSLLQQEEEKRREMDFTSPSC